MAEATFKLVLEDDVSRNARKAEKSLDSLGREMRDLRRSSGKKALGALEDIATGFLKVGKIAAIAGGALGVLAVAGFGKAAVEAADFGQKSRLALTALLGDAAKAEQAMADLRDQSARFGADFQDSVKGFQTLVATGLGATQSKELLATMADLKAVMGLNNEELSRTLTAITQIESKGKLQAEELLQIQENARLGRGKIFEALAKNLGKSTQEVQKLQEQGKISAEQFRAAFKSAVLGLTKTDIPGAFAEAKVDKSLGGILDRAKAQFAGFLDVLGQSIGPSLLKAAKPLGKLLSEALKSKQAQAFMDGLAGGAKVLAAAVKGAVPFVKEFLKGFAQGIGDFLGPLKEGVKTLGLLFGGENQSEAEAMKTAVREIARGLGFMATAAAGALGLAALLAAGIASVIGVISGLAGRFFTLGASIVSGLIQGIASMVGVLITKVANIASTIRNTFASALQIFSPSRVFEGFGASIGAGLVVGLEGSTPEVRMQTEDVAQSTLRGFSDGVSTGGGLSIGNLSQSTTVNTAATDPDAVAEAVDARQRETLYSLLEELAVEAGAA